MPKATIGAIVDGVETRAMPEVNRSRPSVSSSSAINTVTPVTIRITPHGIPLIAFCSSTVRSSMRAVAMMIAIMPTFMPNPATLMISARDPGRRHPVARVHGLDRGLRGLNRRRDRAA